MVNLESKQTSLTDAFDFRPDIKILDSFSPHSIGTVYLLQKGEMTCVFSIDLSLREPQTIYSPFQKPNDTLLTYSCFFRELRKGYNSPNFDLISNIIFGVPDFIQIRPILNEAKST
jgi:hypothetical protein